MNIQQHRTRPHISIDQHVKNRVVELGGSLEARTAIYLDTNFWILLRKAESGSGQDVAVLELLSLLRSGVTARKLFCPISESVFLELLKQSDAASRIATAHLIDELSLGVTLLHNQARFATELAHFFHSFEAGSERLHPLRHLVWSKLSYVLGVLHPSSTPFDADTELAIQKAFFDKMWTVPLTTMMKGITEVPDQEGLKLTDIAIKLTDGNFRHADAIRSFDQVWTDELKGVADLCADIAVEIISDIAERNGDSRVAPGSPEWKQYRSMCANILFYSLKRRPDVRIQLRSLYIEASLHAALRWDKSRPFKGNDLYDFNHASAALGYCHAFFTERPLQTLIASKHIALDQLHRCVVISEVPEAIAFLKTLDVPEPSHIASHAPA